MKTWIHVILIVIVCNLIVCNGFPAKDNTADDEVDEDKDPSDHHLFYGLEEKEAPKIKKLVRRLKKLRAEKLKIKVSDSELENPLIGDVAMTPDQVKHYLSEEEEDQSKRPKQRVKRHSLDFEAFNFTRWEIPIHYSIQRGYFTKIEKKNIRDAFRRWEELTCIRFKEDRKFQGRMLHIRGDQDGCWSFVGKRNDLIKQTINLMPPYCVILKGVIMHEIGHAIGLYHMEDVPERDQYIFINENNIREDSKVNLVAVNEKDVNRYNVPWDYASIMQFRRDSFSIDSKSYTILSRDPEYFYTAGMVDDISYFDATTVNRGYQCQDYCNSINGQPLFCKNEGYPNPGVLTECGQCLCSTGLAGDCSEPEIGSQGCSPGSGRIAVTETGGCLESPGYGAGGYTIGDSCSWILESPEGTGIQFTFDVESGFGVYHFNASGGICNHYVEIKFNGNFTTPGKRHCGDENYNYNQNELLLTYTNKALVYFNAKSPEVFDEEPEKRLGFRVCYQISKKLGKKCKRINKKTGKCKGKNYKG